MPIPSIRNLENDFSRLFRSDLADRILEGNPTATCSNISWTLGPTKYIGLLNSSKLIHPIFTFLSSFDNSGICVHCHFDSFCMVTVWIVCKLLNHFCIMALCLRSNTTAWKLMDVSSPRKWSIYPVPTNLMISPGRSVFSPAWWSWTGPEDARCPAISWNR